MEEWIAHISEDGERTQSVDEHECGAAALAKKFGDVFGLGDVAAALARNHDAGKFSVDFQKYIRGELRRRIDHSTAGAKYLWENKKIYSQMSVLGAFCISGHHSGLLDRGTKVSEAGDPTLYGRMQKDIPGYEEIKEHICFGDGATNEAIRKFVSGGKWEEADWMMLTRMLFSCLVDADFLDTERFMQGNGRKPDAFPSLDILHEKFFEKLSRDGYLQGKTPVNEKRSEILRTCIRKGKGNPGLYTMTVPTGGGKTISSLAFALEHAKTHGKKRIIYVIPYLAIIDQTAEVFREFLGKEAVLECHSNVNYEGLRDGETDGTSTAEYMKLATENWDAPLIVTTSEQFWESLYANRTSKCRKLHNIAESVIIFDEAQMIPVDYLAPCLKALEQLVCHYGCTAVLCSATQPALGPYFKKTKSAEIMEDIEGLYQFFKRVRFQLDQEKTYEEIAVEMGKQKQALCIASTKKEAKEIFDRIEDEDCFYLSTNLCPAHRKEVVREMKRRLKNGEPCHVVATSVISVGVDIDFPVVYLEYTGLDGLIQGAGRCNREGKRAAEDSIAHVFWTEKNRESSFMKKEKQATDYICGKYADISVPDAIREYFRVWYQNSEGGFDRAEIAKKSEDLKFAEIGKSMRLIAEDTKSVLIRYNQEAEEIWAELQSGKRTRELMRRAGQYIVNLRYSPHARTGSDFTDLLGQGKISYFENDSELAYLVDAKDYDVRFGICTEIHEGEGIMW